MGTATWPGSSAGAMRSVHVRFAVALVLCGGFAVCAVIMHGPGLALEGGTAVEFIRAHGAQGAFQMLVHGYTENKRSCGDSDHYCNDHGNCILDPVSEGRMGVRYFHCDCQPQWEGLMCKERLTKKCPFGGTNHECSGNGDCIPGAKIGSFHCCCLDGWEGHACNKQNPKVSGVGCSRDLR